mmetsp:Transcript_6118/g.9232  ORF Transcript_6118/g.9232 Transcript_6118/m.9232 type:complete len:350 (-) Transcript_6118:211-1260(-)|eukprot:CAMPEP_0185025220 /NCGR_PEP_ID=MMETSP1103-20130426/8263_1 /TAXON_ID=36769 /ORGANISM="Paraphysomonas bandaiensis, Strain Caron Lab Isolate" /LENGTH=349 /DNA_ID=CAMNT_0027558371 /DNA_START=24 /DNA_END=1073 /DNA_ORIENTATION=-
MIYWLLSLHILGCALAGSSFSTWSPIPTARRGAVGGILYNSKDYPEVWVTGGYNPDIQNTGSIVEVYNTAYDEWRAVVSLSEGRSDHGAAPLAGALYVGGGITDDMRNTSSVEKYTSNDDAWSEVTPLNTARTGLAFASDEENGLLYAVGGMRCISDCTGVPVEYLGTLEVYDVTTGVWTDLPPMPTPRRDLSVGVVGSKLYAVGGCGGDGSTLDYENCEAQDAVEVYDPETKIWSSVAPMPSPRHSFALGVYGTQLIAAGGASASGDLSKAVWSYDSVGDKWFAITTMPDPRMGLVKGYNMFVGISMFLISGVSSDGTYENTNEYMALMCSPRPSSDYLGNPESLPQC